MKHFSFFMLFFLCDRWKHIVSLGKVVPLYFILRSQPLLISAVDCSHLGWRREEMGGGVIRSGRARRRKHQDIFDRRDK